MVMGRVRVWQLGAMFMLLCSLAASAVDVTFGEIVMAPGDTPVIGETVTFAMSVTPGENFDVVVKFDFNGDGTYDGLTYTVPKNAAGQTVATVTTSAPQAYYTDDLQTVICGIFENGVEVGTEVVFFEPVVKPEPDAENGVDQGDVEVNEDDGFGCTVSTSWDGYVELIFNLVSSSGVSARDLNDVEVDWGDGSGRTTHGGTQRHNFKEQQAVPNGAGSRQGIFVVTATEKDPETGSPKKKLRKTLVFGAEDMGEELPAGIVPPPVENRGVTGTKISGKFGLGNPTKKDSVSVTFEIELPAGLTPKAENTIEIAVGNIVEDVDLDAKGRASPQKENPASRFKKVQIKYPKLAKGTTVTAAGQKALVTVQLASNDLDESGFDTEGINNKNPDKPKKPKIQVGARVAGVPFNGEIDADFALSKDGTGGSIRFAK